jgi:hypothetical protein
MIESMDSMPLQEEDPRHSEVVLSTSSISGKGHHDGSVSSSSQPLDAEQSFSNLGFEPTAVTGAEGNDASWNLLASLDESTQACSTGEKEEEEPSNNSTSSMKLEFVNSDGKLAIQVTGGNDAMNDSKSRVKPKIRRRLTTGTDITSPHRVKGTPTGGGKPQRNHRVQSVSPAKPKEIPHKPLMDLRSILQKHEKKRESPIAQEYEKVSFYGSMSAIPFLTKKPVDETKTTTTTPTTKSKPSARKSESVVAVEVEKIERTVNAERAQSVSPTPQKPKLPTQDEITVTAEYDEAQLHLWKSMSALDVSRDSIQRPQEMLPLRPSIRPKNILLSPSRPSGVRAFSRPDDWLNRPQMKSPVKGYRKSRVIEPPTESDILVVEAETTKEIE